MQTVAQGQELARLLVDIAHLAGRKAVALLSDMNQPLGFAVGNALEVKEAIETLHGGGPQDFREHCLVTAGHLLALGGKAIDPNHGHALAQTVLSNDQAWEYFRRLVIAQGGDIRVVDEPERLPQARYIENVLAPRSGYLGEINALQIGEAAMRLGAGRAKKGEPIDHAVGAVIAHKVGDYVRNGDLLFTLHANDQRRLDDERESILNAHVWSETAVSALPLFYGVIA
jgi:pyrimidine-nucleoside phosphorylase